jgi:DNA-binding response OmpR family regulator
LVITDLFGSTCYDRNIATRQLGELRARYPGVPVLLVTAHSAAWHDRELLPARAVILKPFDVDTLTQLVRTLTRG